MANWREELTEAVKTKAERDAEEAARAKQRVQEALGTAQAAFELALEAIRYAHDRIAEKGQPVSIEPIPEDKGKGSRLVLGALSLGLQIDAETAILRVHVAETKPREFDFARDRHITATDVEEYVGRRVLELVKVAQKAAPW